MTEYNPADEQQVNERSAKKKFDHKAKQQFLRDILKDRQGRDFFWDLLSMAGIFHTSFNPSNAVTAYNEGRRSLGLQVLADITAAAPEAYVTMIKESQGD